ncbi:MAG: arginine repressor [Clostridia bacterium]|nr:arginine repressor [Clostridia bacterium]
MSCDNRRLRILELIKKYNVGRQDQLVELLNAEGFGVTQATVSRDINELQLKKIKEGGVFRYIQADAPTMITESKVSIMFKQTVNSVAVSQNLIIVKTLAGSANAVCAILDNFNLEGVLGSVAGDDCIFIATEPGKAEAIANTFRSYL